MDEKILMLLNENAEAGMSLLMEQYMGLLWSACRLYLNNPEDIRECVQETFLDFYEHRSRFEQEKGTIKAYLYVIAKRKALKTARKNKDASWLPLDEKRSVWPDSEESLLDREVLEQALKRLTEEDSRIIRMKYYEGMSCQEIAHAMHLPVETVKKRQQRSLKKLRRILAALVLLALLTACAAAVVYHIRFSPSLGIQNAEEAAWYEMAEAPVVAETAQGDVTIRNIIWKEKQLYLQLEFEPQAFATESTDLYEHIWLEGSNGQERKSSSYSNYGADGMLEKAEMRYRNIEEPDTKIPYTFHIFDAVCRIYMEPIGQYEDLQDIGMTETYEGRTIVLRPDSSAEILRADAYVYSDDVWKIRRLIDPEDAGAEDDRILWKRNELVDEYSFSCELETSADGSCTVEIDRLLLQSEGDTPMVEIPIPEDSIKTDIPFVLGGDTYRISEIKWDRGAFSYEKENSQEEFETVTGDELLIKVEPVKLEKNTYLQEIQATLGYMQTKYSYRYNKENKKLDIVGEHEQFTALESNNAFGYETEPFDGYIHLSIIDPEQLPKENICLRIDSIYKLWDQNYTFQIQF